jgi:hypothetical protein
MSQPIKVSEVGTGTSTWPMLIICNFDNKLCTFLGYSIISMNMNELVESGLNDNLFGVP